MMIYEPQEDSFLLEKQVKKYALGRVLDLGTGSGIQAVAAAGNKLVREVIAVDINPEAVKRFQEIVTKNKFKKIQILVSNLFSNVECKFDIIIFNPPYLPQDAGIEDAALYGGKKGWEISERFFHQAAKFLAPKGKILFLFSSLTNKTKIDEIISHNLFEAQELVKEKLPFFEELYVYSIHKSDILHELERKGVSDVHYLTKGHRGMVYSGTWNTDYNIKSHFSSKKTVKIAIKVENSTSKASNRIKNEARWLKILNEKNIGPKLYFSGTNYVVMEFIEGKRIMDWIKEHSKEEIIPILEKILIQGLTMDQLGVSKQEMHHPHKHIIVSSKDEVNRKDEPIMIDFERCKETLAPTNVTQLVEWLCRSKNELGQKGIKVKVELLRTAAQAYKMDKSNFKIILNPLRN
jgi:release factor glutamine methyltransferase